MRPGASLSADPSVTVRLRRGLRSVGWVAAIPATFVQAKPSRQGLPSQGRSDVGCSTLTRHALSTPQRVDEGRRDGSRLHDDEQDIDLGRRHWMETSVYDQTLEAALIHLYCRRGLDTG